MRIFQLFERRSAVMEMALFAYAVGVAGLVCIHMPIFGYEAYVLLLLMFVLMAYALWWLARPESSKSYLFLALTLTGIAAAAVLLFSFGSEVAAFSVEKLHNSVTEELRQTYRNHLLLLFLLHTVISAAVTYGFYELFGTAKYDTLRLFALSWAALPALFVLMNIYGLFLPLT